MKKVLDIFKKPLWLLCLGLGIVLFSSIFANMANTSAYQVSVTEVTMETGDNQKLVGLRYAPKSCTESNKCATIITTHGYLNSKEMQDEAAIELSKRGYIVYAMDMYDHGDSERENGGFTFWLTSQWDAVNWVYDNDKALLKAADGTGMIAVAGHSMGGFSSRVAAYRDALSVKFGGTQKIVAVLSMGADYQWPETFGMSADSFIENVGNRSYGTIAGRYDEFFFNSSCSVAKDDKGEEYAKCSYAGNKVVEKNWGENVHGKATYYGTTVLEMTKNGSKYDTVHSAVWNDSIEGGRVIYIPNEIHPWNHFSIESTAYQVDFYDTAFEKQIAIHNVTENQGVVAYEDGKAQTWWLKEGFECIALIGMFIAVVAAIGVFAGLPFFNKVTTAGEEINEVSRPTGARANLMKIFVVVSCFATTWAYPMINLGTTEAYTESLKALMWASAIVLLAAGIAHFVIKAVKGENETASNVLGTVAIGGISVFAASFFSYWTFTNTFFADSTYYNEPGTTTIAQWALISAGLTLVSLAISHFLSNKKDGYTCANYGLKANWKQILIALLIAVIVVTGVYAITFLIEVLLRVDFRVWTYAIKPFGINHFATFFRYLPVFFLFYLVNGISVIANTGHDKTWKGTLKGILVSALGVALLIGLHYGMLAVTGTAKFPTQALNMILTWALVPTLAISAWIARKSYFKTGNIWTGVFINAILFTLIQVANTTLYLS